MKRNIATMNLQLQHDSFVLLSAWSVNKYYFILWVDGCHYNSYQ